MNILVLFRPSRAPFACGRVKILKKATVTTGLYGTTFCLPGPGRRNGVCRISVLGEQSFAQVLECGGGVCLCSPSSSLSRRIFTAWWYSLSTLPNLLFIDTSIQTPYHCTHSFTLRSSLRVFDYIHSDAI